MDPYNWNIIDTVNRHTPARTISAKKSWIAKSNNDQAWRTMMWLNYPDAYSGQGMSGEFKFSILGSAHLKRKDFEARSLNKTGKGQRHASSILDKDWTPSKFMKDDGDLPSKPKNKEGSGVLVMEALWLASREKREWKEKGELNVLLQNRLWMFCTPSYFWRKILISISFF